MSSENFPELKSEFDEFGRVCRNISPNTAQYQSTTTISLREFGEFGKY